MAVPVKNHETDSVELHYAGRVLKEWENNGYHDSDWYVLVQEEDGSFRSFCYATTRGGSVAPNAKVDATEEVKAAYAAYQARNERIRTMRRLRDCVKEARVCGITARQWIEVRYAVSPKNHLETPQPDSRYLVNVGILPWADPIVGRMHDALRKLENDSFRSDFKRSLAQQVKDWATTPAEKRRHPSPLSPRQLRYIG